MSVDLLLWVLADAVLEAKADHARFMSTSIPWWGRPDSASEWWADEHERRSARLGAWRMTWWRKS